MDCDAESAVVVVKSGKGRRLSPLNWSKKVKFGLVAGSSNPLNWIVPALAMDIPASRSSGHLANQLIVGL